MKSTKLHTFLESIPPLIIGGEKYHWECFGPEARYLDFEDNLSVIFDEKTKELYMIEWIDEDDVKLKWVHPEHIAAYEKYSDDMGFETRTKSTVEDCFEALCVLVKSYAK